jgi:hypothetical protein
VGGFRWVDIAVAAVDGPDLGHFGFGQLQLRRRKIDCEIARTGRRWNNDVAFRHQEGEGEGYGSGGDTMGFGDP